MSRSSLFRAVSDDTTARGNMGRKELVPNTAWAFCSNTMQCCNAQPILFTTDGSVIISSRS